MIIKSSQICHNFIVTSSKDHHKRS